MLTKCETYFVRTETSVAPNWLSKIAFIQEYWINSLQYWNCRPNYVHKLTKLTLDYLVEVLINKNECTKLSITERKKEKFIQFPRSNSSREDHFLDERRLWWDFFHFIFYFSWNMASSMNRLCLQLLNCIRFFMLKIRRNIFRVKRQRREKSLFK